MKPFFTDQQIRKFTLKEKFEYIFKQLNLLIQPKTKKRTERTLLQHINIYKSISFIECLTFNENGIPLINNIELPFIGMEIKVENELIKITGEKFCYKFPPEMMPEIWRRLKRML